jgi:hypothetical protein
MLTTIRPVSWVTFEPLTSAYAAYLVRYPVHNGGTLGT